MRKLRDELQHGRYSAMFFPGGNFVGQDSLRSQLQQADLRCRSSNRRSRMTFSYKLRNLITGSALVTDAEVQQEFQKQNAKIKFDYAVLRKDDLLKEIHPSEAELKAFYDRNKATYNNSIPEKRKIRYVVLEMAKIQAEHPVSHRNCRASTISIRMITAFPSRSTSATF